MRLHRAADRRGRFLRLRRNGPAIPQREPDFVARVDPACCRPLRAAASLRPSADPWRARRRGPDWKVPTVRPVQFSARWHSSAALPDDVRADRGQPLRRQNPPIRVVRRVRPFQHFERLLVLADIRQRAAIGADQRFVARDLPSMPVRGRQRPGPVAQAPAAIARRPERHPRPADLRGISRRHFRRCAASPPRCAAGMEPMRWIQSSRARSRSRRDWRKTRCGEQGRPDIG